MTDDVNEMRELIRDLAFKTFGAESLDWNMEDIRGAVDCPFNEPLHVHHDGCPACDMKESRNRHE